MSSYPAESIVLHRTLLGENDKILTLLTVEEGKLSAVAKGSRKPTSRLSGATELFIHSRMLLARGRSLDIVSQCEVQNTFHGLRLDLPLLARGTYLCELVDRMVEERHPEPAVFHLLLSALLLLEQSGPDPDQIVHAFELHLLDERGYALCLDCCVRCGGDLPGDKLGFSPSAGGVLCRNCRFAHQDAFAVHALSVRRLLLLSQANNEELIALSSHEIDPSIASEIQRCLKWYIRYRIDRDLKSAEFLEMLRVTMN